MSEEKKDVVASEETDSKSDPQFVKKEAYAEVSADMHKYKAQLKEEKAARAEYEAKLKALEEEGMREKEQWKELYEKQRAEAEAERQRAAREREAYYNSVKRSALKQELGGVKDEYLSFANLEALELDENGNVIEQSLHQIVNEFRQNHAALIPKSDKSTITQTASPIDTNLHLDKPLDNMTFEEKVALLKSGNLK